MFEQHLSLCFQLKLIIIVFVTNVNDNPPVFDQDVYRVVVSEVRVSFSSFMIMVHFLFSPIFLELYKSSICFVLLCFLCHRCLL